MVSKSTVKAILEGIHEVEYVGPDKTHSIHGTYGGLTLAFYRGRALPMLELNLAGEGRSARAVFWEDQVNELIEFLQSIQADMAPRD